MNKSAINLLENLEVIKLIKNEKFDCVDELEFCGCGKGIVDEEGMCELCIQRQDEEGDERKHPDDNFK